MSNDIESNQINYIRKILLWAKVCAEIAEDLSRAILGFIPNGLNLAYDHGLKSTRGFAQFFSHRRVEKVFKLCTGITLGQGLAQDSAHFIFWPLGFVIGALGGTVLAHTHYHPIYQGQIGKTLYRLSGPTVTGGLLGVICLAVACQCFPSLLAQRQAFSVLSTFVLAGAACGLILKMLLMLAINKVQASHTDVIRRNVQRAKELNSKLKILAKEKAKKRILMQAQDIIQQMNGSQSQPYLKSFFEEQYEAFAASTYQKIERHFNYLADRACHGDVDALKRLKELSFSHKVNDEQSPLDVMLNRIFNARAIAKIKDDVDTIYDKWHYRFLAQPTTN